MTTKQKTVVITKATTPTLKKYFNNTNRNIFTTKGRVGPSESVMLTKEEASQHTNLSEV